MANETLDGLKVAILVTDGFEQVEMTEPRKALDEAGAETQLVSPKDDQVKAWKFTDWGATFPVDMPLDSARPEDFDTLLLPGGVINPTSSGHCPRRSPLPKPSSTPASRLRRSVTAPGPSSRRVPQADGA